MRTSHEQSSPHTDRHVVSKIQHLGGVKGAERDTVHQTTK